MKLRTYILVILLLGWACLFQHVSAEKADWTAMTSGGDDNGTTVGLRLGSALGQTAVGSGSLVVMTCSHGFWQDFNALNGDCCTNWTTPGDANSDHEINLLDILHIINYIYEAPYGDPPNPLGCDELLDASGDGAIDLIDILWEINHVYNDPPGPAPICFQ